MGRVTAEPMPRTTTVVADCTARDCEWSDKAFTNYHGRALRGRARYHAGTTGHEVIVHVETLSATYYRRPR